MSRRVTGLGLMLSALCSATILIGCDDRPRAAPPAKPATIPDEPPRPTTQELLSGPTKKFVVKDIPISIVAPQSWKIETTAGLTMLEGPTPSDSVMIQIAHRDALSTELVDTFIDRMKREGDRQPGPLKRMNTREASNARVIDQLYSGRPLVSPKASPNGLPIVDDKGNIVNTSITPVHWMVTVLVPAGKVFDRYDVNCIGLTLDQYNADRELLERVIASVTYDDTVAPASTPR